jgi:hypothetical protein
MIEEEDRSSKNLYAGCMTTLISVIVFGVICFFSLDAAFIFAFIMAIIVMMIMQ